MVGNGSSMRTFFQLERLTPSLAEGAGLIARIGMGVVVAAMLGAGAFVAMFVGTVTNHGVLHLVQRAELARRPCRHDVGGPPRWWCACRWVVGCGRPRLADRLADHRGVGGSCGRRPSNGGGDELSQCSAGFQQALVSLGPMDDRNRDGPGLCRATHSPGDPVRSLASSDSAGVHWDSTDLPPGLHRPIPLSNSAHVPKSRRS